MLKNAEQTCRAKWFCRVIEARKLAKATYADNGKYDGVNHWSEIVEVGELLKIIDRLSDENEAIQYMQAMEKMVKDVFGRSECKGGQNDPNASSERPPAPQGSGGDVVGAAETPGSLESRLNRAKDLIDRAKLLKPLIECGDSDLRLTGSGVEIGIRPVGRIGSYEIADRLRKALKEEASRYQDELVAEASRILAGKGGPCS